MATATPTRSRQTTPKRGGQATVSTASIEALIASRSKRSYTTPQAERAFWKSALRSLSTNA